MRLAELRLSASVWGAASLPLFSLHGIRDQAEEGPLDPTAPPKWIELDGPTHA